MHLPVKAGGDVPLFNRLLVRLYEGGALDKEFLATVQGFNEALIAASTQARRLRQTQLRSRLLPSPSSE